MSRILITGIAGSGGSYLAEYIVQNHPECQLFGLVRWHSNSSLKNLAAIQDRIGIAESDLCDLGSVIKALQEIKPDIIFHLASHANVHASFITPSAVMQNNVQGTLNLLEAVRALGLNPTIQLCSTSEVYGQVDTADVPIKESCPLKPANPYAISKLAQDMLGLCYFNSYGLKVIRTRAFTYINPRRQDLFSSSFANQCARVEAGLQKEVLHGNLNSIRTLVDVRDICRAYWLAVEKCRPGEVYNIGGTNSMTVGELLFKLTKKCKVPIPTKLSQGLLRPSDVTLQIPDCTKFIAETGWKPEIDFDESLGWLLNSYRDSLARQSSQIQSPPSSG